VSSSNRSAIALVILAVVSCGPGGQAAGPGPPRLIACQLLSKADTAQAMAVSATSLADPTASSAGTDSCVFATRPDSGADAGNEVDVQVLQHSDGATARAVFDRLEKISNGRPVEGVGQAAYLSAAPCAELTVLQRSILLEIRLFSSNVGNCSEQQSAALTSLGMKAAARI
jgi:hypothetical protein